LPSSKFAGADFGEEYEIVCALESLLDRLAQVRQQATDLSRMAEVLRHEARELPSPRAACRPRP
jgi:hypothetical protein